MLNEQAILEILDRIRNRFYGKYRGIVVKVEEGGRGRIKAKVPAVLGETITGWCSPCVPYAGPQAGVTFLPEEGSGVWIEFEGGDVSYPIWSGCFWHDGELPDDAAPDKKVIRTAAGHQILFDGSGPLTSLTITDPNGNRVSLDAMGVTISRSAGKIEVLEAAVKVNDDGMVVT